jgi:predicted amidohydrolase YtcJ
MTGTLFVGFQILDCTREEPDSGEVLVEGARIAAIVRVAGQLLRENVDVIDSRGATLMPVGLIESLSHLSIDDSKRLAIMKNGKFRQWPGKSS